MVGGNKKLKTVSHEDRLSNLPDYLISNHILSHLSTKDAVRTSVLSPRWKSLWQLVPGLDLDHNSIRNFDAFVSFVERFFDSHKESSWIPKLRLCLPHSPFHCKSFLIKWIDIATTQRIQHLDFASCEATYKIPKSIFTCKTLVHLQLRVATFVNAEFVSLPCLKILHLVYVRYTNDTTLQKLISGSPVLENLTILSSYGHTIFLQVHSQTLKRIHINENIRVVIDAPLLQCLKTIVSSTNMLKIINPSFFAKLDIIDFVPNRYVTHIKSVIDILTYISRVKDLVIGNVFWKYIFHYSNSGRVLQFRDLSRLNARISKSNLEMLPIILESCPKLEYFTLDMVGEPFMRHKKKIEPKVMFSTVPQCLVSSLKFVELKRPILGYEGETELVRYLLKNSTILEKLRLDIYYSEKKRCDFLKEILAMPRCCSACEIHCSFVPKIYWV